MAANILDWALFSVHLCLLIPIYFLIKYYSKTKIGDYLLLVGWFTVAITNSLLYQLELLGFINVNSQEILLIYMLITFLLDSLACFFLLLHALRLKWEKFPWYITIIVLLDICIGLITASRAFYLPDMWDIFLFLWQLAGWNMFLTFSCLIYAYSTTKPLIMDKGIIVAKRLWIIFGCMTLITASMIILSPSLLMQFWEFNRFLFLLGNIFLVYIAIRYPEAVLISHAQLNRALNVYSSIMSLQTENEIQDFGMSTLVAYIKQIPVGLIDKSTDI